MRPTVAVHKCSSVHSLPYSIKERFESGLMILEHLRECSRSQFYLRFSDTLLRTRRTSVRQTPRLEAAVPWRPIFSSVLTIGVNLSGIQRTEAIQDE